jgi:hypothetical protein
MCFHAGLISGKLLISWLIRGSKRLTSTDGRSVVSFSNSPKTKSDRDPECARIVSVFVKRRCASGCAVRFGAVWADMRSFGPCVIRSLAQHYEWMQKLMN